MDQYEIKFYRNDDEIEINELPEEYLNGIIQCCRSEITSRERLKRVFKRMINKEE